MTSSQSKPVDPTSQPGGWKWASIEVVLIVAVLALHAGLQVPEVNEPNYLAKAKHYWNPAWCSRDFFLNSADAHVVFYWTFGWTTLLFPLPVVAVIGRLLTYTLLAAGWRALSFAVAPRQFLAVLSAGLVVCFNYHFHMAGEWLVGGVEAKGFAYALVFFGLAQIAANRWNRAWMWLGGATAMHVLVGGWAIVASAFAWFLSRKDPQRPALRSMRSGLAIGAALALIGAWPALMLSGGSDEEVANRAAKVQVIHRLPHHLNPGNFFLSDTPPYVSGFGIRFVLMTAVWAALWRATRDADRLRRVNQCVAGALAITLAGMLIAVVFQQQQNWMTGLLRFYWFRLPDVLVPAGLALSLACLIASRYRGATILRSPWFYAVAAAVGAVVLHLAWSVWQRIDMPVPAADMKMLADKGMEQSAEKAAYREWIARRYRDWLDICRAAEEQTPADARFLTPRRSHTFKWYAGRSEVGTWKEVPQDAASVDEWWSRMPELHRIDKRWYQSFEEVPTATMTQLSRRYGFKYVVTERLPPEEDRWLDLPVVHENDSFILYRVSNLDKATP
jgi:hypothetical protein